MGPHKKRVGKCNNAYPDEAVVELEAHQRGEEGGVGRGGLPHHGGHGGLGAGARPGVEPNLELPVGEACCQCQQQQGQSCVVATAACHLSRAGRGNGTKGGGAELEVL
jgi:hypothetical protein